jgi:toxin ParE1/3/4
MRPDLKLTPTASADVAVAVARYDGLRPALGAQFFAELERVMNQIRESTAASTLVDPPIRRALLKEFPFGVFFVEGAAGEADVVLAVLDLRQDPDVIRGAYQRRA